MVISLMARLTINYTDSCQAENSRNHITMQQKPSYIWNGNYFSLGVMLRLDLENSGDMARVRPRHYNTLEKIRRYRDRSRQIDGLGRLGLETLTAMIY